VMGTQMPTAVDGYVEDLVCGPKFFRGAEATDREYKVSMRSAKPGVFSVNNVMRSSPRTAEDVQLPYAVDHHQYRHDRAAIESRTTSSALRTCAS
jgi:hypothetical protein